jgi:hypothetical protein
VDATGKGLIEFVNFASEKHLINANTAGALRAASREVLSAIEPEGWETLDLRTVDVDDFTTRFERARVGKLKPESLLVYKSRFRNAMQMYFAYLDNPSGWRYKPERPSASRKKTTPVFVPSEGATSDEQPVDPRGPRASTIEYPFPLRQGMVVKLHLPSDLTRPEAKRLAAFIDALALAETLSLPAYAGTNGGETNAAER